MCVFVLNYKIFMGPGWLQSSHRSVKYVSSSFRISRSSHPLLAFSKSLKPVACVSIFDARFPVPQLNMITSFHHIKLIPNVRSDQTLLCFISENYVNITAIIANYLNAPIFSIWPRLKQLYIVSSASQLIYKTVPSQSCCQRRTKFDHCRRAKIDHFQPVRN
jgi:hypothetical protein